MKITWASNPLCTTVELDDGDLWFLREAMEMEYEDSNVSAAWLNEVHDEYVAALRGTHQGDCTCVPCSCLKCGAERYLGIDTIPGLRKHQAHKIDAAFGHDNEHTIDDAIASLENYNPKPWQGNVELWNSCLPRWREEARQACSWLISYRDRLIAAGKP